jgi:signal transduction histidine kinase
MKDEYISAVSHELRTPLTSIRGALALVMSGSAGELPVKAKELLSIALRNSERLVHIVNDILDAEKIESGKMRINMQKVPLAPFLEQALAYNQPYAEKFNVRFKLKTAPPQMDVAADPDRLMQVITNLLSNAAKFSPPESEVEVRARKSNGMIAIEVRDFGPGIPDEFQPHIFGKFAQARNSGARNNEGAGLGLNLSRQLIELMQGEIGFTTKAGEGTTFFVQLQLAAKTLHSEVA